jgi:hypothetical protein
MPSRPRWLLLMHQLPPQPDYFRVKIWRRLRAIGAVPLKNSVYALPNTAEAREDFEWLVREIAEGGGEATLCEANLLRGITNEEVEMLITKAHDRGTDQSSQADQARRRSRRRIPVVTSRPRGATWVTRKGVHVDRIGSAWLIRRFIDPVARFKFVNGAGYTPSKGEIRFDMFEAEFTHIGASCTFEVLMHAFGLDRNRALTAVAEIVHDIDCKDDSFGREETPETDEALRELYSRYASDDARLEHGAVLFDNLYAMFGGRLSAKRPRR